MAETVQEFFQNLGSRADSSKVAGMTNSYVFDIEGAGLWKVDVDDGKVTVTEGGGDADATISATEETFQKIAAGAKANCPLSKALKSVAEISMTATLKK